MVDVSDRDCVFIYYNYIPQDDLGVDAYVLSYALVNNNNNNNNTIYF